MMTGIPNVNDIFCSYHLVTLLFLFMIAIYDVRHHKIRNKALLVFLLWCLFSLPITVFANASASWFTWIISCFLGSFTGFFMFLFLAMVTGGSIGGGDIKLVGILGLLYGLTGLLAVLIFACCIILLHYVYSKFLKNKTMVNIPFAPYLFLGAAIYILPQLYTL